jgi:hypothetical protein
MELNDITREIVDSAFNVELLKQGVTRMVNQL